MKKETRYLVLGDYMAGPAVHIFNNRIYIYLSHNWKNGIEENDGDDHFNMKDYHVLSTDDIMSGEIKNHGVVLQVEDIPWTGHQLQGYDVARKGGEYYMYFSPKGQNDTFRIGVATDDNPEGSFAPQASPTKGSRSIDPAILDNEDDDFYMYFDGPWGGQPQYYRDDKALERAVLPEDDKQALPARMAKFSKDMLEFIEEPKVVVTLDENGKPLTGGDNERRFLGASWMRKYNGKYYFSYSASDTHRLCCTIDGNPYGPFTYQGVVLIPVVSWTTYHAIVEYKGKWYLFHHDCVPFNGKTWLRSLKVCGPEYDVNGRIITIEEQ